MVQEQVNQEKEEEEEEEEKEEEGEEADQTSKTIRITPPRPNPKRTCFFCCDIHTLCDFSSITRTSAPESGTGPLNHSSRWMSCSVGRRSAHPHALTAQLAASATRSEGWGGPHYSPTTLRTQPTRVRLEQSLQQCLGAHGHVAVAVPPQQTLVVLAPLEVAQVLRQRMHKRRTYADTNFSTVCNTHACAVPNVRPANMTNKMTAALQMSAARPLYPRPPYNSLP